MQGQSVFANDVEPAILPNANTSVACGLYVSSFDFPEVAQNWQTTNTGLGLPPSANNWQWMFAQSAPANPFAQAVWQHLTVGPELLSDLAHSNATTYDLETLGGGARFVGLFMAGFGAGRMLSPTGPLVTLKYTVEDAPGPNSYGSLTYAYPVQAIQNEILLPGLSDDPFWTVAQWQLQRLGSMPQVSGNGNNGVNCSVNVINCNDFALAATINYFVGTSIDRTASPGTAGARTVVAAGVPGSQEPGFQRIPPDNGLGGVAVNGPYSYAHLQLITPVAVASTAVGFNAIVYVAVS
jgi:hypothetical protein